MFIGVILEDYIMIALLLKGVKTGHEVEQILIIWTQYMTIIKLIHIDLGNVVIGKPMFHGWL